jgi:hypothetical protein
LQPFAAGVAVRRQSNAAILVHPLRDPKRVPKMLTSGAIRPADLFALSRWVIPALRPGVLKKTGNSDITLKAALDESGVRGELRRMIDRFLAGVLLDDTGSSSNAFALLLTRMFVLGVPALPAAGMQALPRLLAAALGDRIALNHGVNRIERSGTRWQVSGPDGMLLANDVVVATDPTTAASLTGSTPPPTHGVVTYWWSSDDIPTARPMLWVDGRSDAPGPVLNTAVISAAAPGYAPQGEHLIAASALLGPDGSPPPEIATRQHAADIMGVPGGHWTLLTRNVIHHALPAQPARCGCAGRSQSVTDSGGAAITGTPPRYRVRWSVGDGRQNRFCGPAGDQVVSDHRNTARQAARPPAVHAVSTKNMCQCSQLPAGSKAAIFAGSSTDRKP